MRAMRLHALNERLRLDEIETPTPGPGQVRLRVEACGLNFADTLHVKGRYQEKKTLPSALGGEVCGIVDALGEGVTHLAPGERVAAMVEEGLAEFALADARLCTPVPEGMSPEAAASFQVAYGTSHVALDHLARMQPGERLLVTGAAGGVGLTAVEIGKLMGAEVIACARGAERLEIARQAGADHLLDSQTQDIREVCLGLGGLDVVYDAVGGEQWTAAFRACRFGARLLPIGFASGEVPQIPANHLLVKNLTAIGFWVGAYKTHAPQVLSGSLAQLFAWWREGKLNPHVSNVLPLEEAEAGLDLLRTRAATGKVVVRIG